MEPVNDTVAFRINHNLGMMRRVPNFHASSGQRVEDYIKILVQYRLPAGTVLDFEASEPDVRLVFKNGSFRIEVTPTFGLFKVVVTGGSDADDGARTLLGKQYLCDFSGTFRTPSYY